MVFLLWERKEVGEKNHGNITGDANHMLHAETVNTSLSNFTNHNHFYSFTAI